MLVLGCAHDIEMWGGGLGYNDISMYVHTQECIRNVAILNCTTIIYAIKSGSGVGV